MLNRLFPERVDNDYRGRDLALWLFVLLVLLKSIVAANSILNGAYVATHADGIPLDTFSSGGAQTVVTLFALWGVSQLVLCLLCLVVLFRYRAMVPFMFGLLLVEFASRRLILLLMPVVKREASSGLYVQLVVLILIAIGFALSLRSRPAPQAQE